MKDTRKSPEEWLRSTEEERTSGRLKIFLGYAPGVGKTYSMLSEGIRRHSRGEDIVIGIIETHGRAGTAELAEKLDQFRDETGPPGLVACPKTRAVISVEVLVEEQVILPMRICLEFLCASVNRPPASLIPKEDPGQPSADFTSYLEQIHPFSRASRALDFEVWPIKWIHLQ